MEEESEAQKRTKNSPKIDCSAGWEKGVEIAALSHFALHYSGLSPSGVLGVLARWGLVCASDNVLLRTLWMSRSSSMPAPCVR